MRLDIFILSDRLSYPSDNGRTITFDRRQRFGKRDRIDIVDRGLVCINLVLPTGKGERDRVQPGL